MAAALFSNWFKKNKTPGILHYTTLILHYGKHYKTFILTHPNNNNKTTHYNNNNNNNAAIHHINSIYDTTPHNTTYNNNNDTIHHIDTIYDTTPDNTTLYNNNNNDTIGVEYSWSCDICGTGLPQGQIRYIV